MNRRWTDKITVDVIIVYTAIVFAVSSLIFALIFYK